jgi:hypothetical protein
MRRVAPAIVEWMHTRRNAASAPRTGAPRSQPRARRRAIVGCGSAALLAALACTAQRALELQKRMVGVSAGDLRSCLGPPSSFEELDGRTVWLYEAPYSKSEQDVTIEIAEGPGAAANPPRVTSGDTARDTVRSTESRTSSEGRGIPRGTCVLLFELENGAVRRFRSAGRSSAGVDAAAECAFLVRRCAPPASPPVPPPSR